MFHCEEKEKVIELPKCISSQSCFFCSKSDSKSGFQQTTSYTVICEKVIRLVTATEHDPLLSLALTLGVSALGLALDESLSGLVKGNTQ